MTKLSKMNPKKSKSNDDDGKLPPSAINIQEILRKQRRQEQLRRAQDNFRRKNDVNEHKRKQKNKSKNLPNPIRPPDPLRELITRGGRNQPPVHYAGTLDTDDKIAERFASVFQRRMKKIRQATDKGEYTERTMLKMYKALLDTVLDLIPIAEKNYRQYKVDRSAYALNTYINQARQIAIDMRSIQDFEQQAMRIIEMIRSSFTLVAQNMVDEVYRIRKELSTSVPPKRRLRFEEKLAELTKSHGRYLNETIKGLSATVLDFLTEKPTTQDATSKKE